MTSFGESGWIFPVLQCLSQTRGFTYGHRTLTSQRRNSAAHG